MIFEITIASIWVQRPLLPVPAGTGGEATLKRIPLKVPNQNSDLNKWVTLGFKALAAAGEGLVGVPLPSPGAEDVNAERIRFVAPRRWPVPLRRRHHVEQLVGPAAAGSSRALPEHPHDPGDELVLRPQRRRMHPLGRIPAHAPPHSPFACRQEAAALGAAALGLGATGRGLGVAAREVNLFGVSWC